MSLKNESNEDSMRIKWIYVFIFLLAFLAIKNLVRTEVWVTEIQTEQRWMICFVNWCIVDEQKRFYYIARNCYASTWLCNGEYHHVMFHCDLHSEESNFVTLITVYRYDSRYDDLQLSTKLKSHVNASLPLLPSFLQMSNNYYFIYGVKCTL